MCSGHPQAARDARESRGRVVAMSGPMGFLMASKPRGRRSPAISAKYAKSVPSPNFAYFADNSRGCWRSFLLREPADRQPTRCLDRGAEDPVLHRAPTGVCHRLNAV